MKTIAFLDSMNLFSAGFAKNPMLNSIGVPIGGISTVLNTIRYIASTYVLSDLVICWDGKNGVLNKRKYLPEYKQKKVSLQKRYNREDYVAHFDNRENQVALVRKLIDCLPIRQICLDDLEGDDTLFIVHEYFRQKNGGFKGIIVSHDKDYYQMLAENTIVYRPHFKGMEYTLKDFQKDFGIKNPKNFAIYKALVGDASDNIKGLKGVGKAAFNKKFKWICETEEEWPMDLVMNYVQPHIEEEKVYNQLIENKDIVSSYYRAIKFEPKLLDKYFEVIKEQAEEQRTFRYSSMLLLCLKNSIDNYAIEPLLEVFGTYKVK